MTTIERQRPKEQVGSDAFRNEYADVPIQVIVDDVASYLGEYRFNLPKYRYSFRFKDGKLRDPHRTESMEDLAQRAIERKIAERKSSLRERAEKQGFMNLDSQLRYAREGDAVIWASPPGPKSEGYGDYGFVYFGKVEDENIKMTAIRVENPSIEKFRKAVYMLTGEKIDYEFAEDFLDSPRVVHKDMKEGYVDAILKRVFDFEPNEKEQEKFRQIIKKMFPLIYDFARNRLRKREDLYALENYVLELKRDYYISDREAPSNLQDLGVIYRNEPPKAAGSCGSTESNNIFNSVFSLNSLDKYGSRSFECPSCGKTNIRPKDKLISNCQHCGKDVAC